MARTNKRGGNSARLKYPSPNKFIKAALGASGKLGKSLFGGRDSKTAEGRAQIEADMKDQHHANVKGSMGIDLAAMEKSRGIFGGGRPNLQSGPPIAGKLYDGGAGAPGMSPGPLAKRAGFKKYKSGMCPTPMKRFYGQLVTGAYDATSGKGTAKYGQIAKARAFGDIAETIGETTASWARVQAPKRRISMKKNLKNQMKTNKLRQRKSKGWLDKMRYA